jgi:hypothetical protein
MIEESRVEGDERQDREARVLIEARSSRSYMALSLSLSFLSSLVGSFDFVSIQSHLPEFHETNGWKRVVDGAGRETMSRYICEFIYQ